MMTNPNYKSKAVLRRLDAINRDVDICFPFAFVDFGETSFEQDPNAWMIWLMGVMSQKSNIDSYNGGFSGDATRYAPTMLTGQRMSFTHQHVELTTRGGMQRIYAYPSDSANPVWRAIEALLSECGRPVPFLDEPSPTDRRLVVDVVYAHFDSQWKAPHLRIRKRTIGGKTVEYEPDAWDVVWPSPGKFRHAVFVPNLFVALTEAFDSDYEVETPTGRLVSLADAAKSNLLNAHKIRYLQYLAAVVDEVKSGQRNLTEYLMPFADAFKAFTDNESILCELAKREGEDYSRLAKKEAWLKAVGEAEKNLRTRRPELNLRARRTF